MIKCENGKVELIADKGLQALYSELFMIEHAVISYGTKGDATRAVEVSRELHDEVEKAFIKNDMAQKRAASNITAVPFHRADP